MTKKVVCTLSNDGTINGIKFDCAGGSAVALLDDDQAAQFDGIPGYEVSDYDPEATSPKKGGRGGKNAEQGTLEGVGAEPPHAQ